MLNVFSDRYKYFKKLVFRVVGQRTLTDILTLYSKLGVRTHNSFLNPILRFQSIFFLSTPKRQFYYTIYNLREQKQLNYSSGRFLKLFSNNAKFYKKSNKNIGPTTMHLRKLHKFLLKRIFFFKLKNFSYKHYVFWLSFFENIKPEIYYFLHKLSYIPRWQGKRRIKRVVLRLIGTL